jgi:hypothetical protein
MHQTQARVMQLKAAAEATKRMWIAEKKRTKAAEEANIRMWIAENKRTKAAE